MWEVERQGRDGLLRLHGNWLVRESGVRRSDELRQVLSEVRDCAMIHFDTRGLGHWDSALVAFVYALQDQSDLAGHTFELDLSSLPESLQRLLALAKTDRHPELAINVHPPPSAVPLLGPWAVGWWEGLVASADLIGTTTLSVIPALRGRIRARAADIITLMQQSGGGALVIIAIVNSLVGAILAFVGAVQLQRFGAGIYDANLVGIAVVREMAAIMTAIVMAGRTGGSYAAQIATMEGSEEIDALRAFGISPYQYLILPRIVALVTMMPVLYFYGCLLGILGGLVVAVSTLHMSTTVFLEQLRPAVLPTEFYIGLSKSICFGIFIAITSCQVGLSAGRSAAEVGRAATDAVVICIIGIIALDAVFAACSNVLGI
jgi:phospholipid/cholesterol/gamma-HCH transport system permease protein